MNQQEQLLFAALLSDVANHDLQANTWLLTESCKIMTLAHKSFVI